MACAISISDSPNDVWMVKNSLFGAFADEIIARFSDERDIVTQIKIATATNGLSLDVLYVEDPKLSIRLRHALQTTASDIGKGTVSLPTGANELSRIRQLFGELAKMLERFHPEENGEAMIEE